MSPFHDLENGEWRSIVRPKEIKMWGVFPLRRGLAKTACLPTSQKIELFSGNAPQQTGVSGNFFLFLLIRFRLWHRWILVFLFWSSLRATGHH